MSNLQKTFGLLLIIIIIASALRLWRITDYPPGFTADEAAIGYNAYSLLVTGKDEYGTPWPLVFRSFDDYKPPVYFYLTLPFVALLGPGELAVRLPSALLGVGTVLAVYFLVGALLKDKPLGKICQLVAAFLLAISPWHLHYSRGGWETNAGTFLLTLGLLLFVYGLKKPRLLVLATVFLALSLYTYHSMRVVVPVVLFFYAVIFHKQLLAAKKTVVIAVMVGVFMITPLVVQFVGGSGSARFAGVGIFADPGPFWQINQLRGEHKDSNSPLARLFHNRPVAYGLSFVSHYFDHFSPQFLFFRGDPIGRNNVPGVGQLYLFDLFLFPVGGYFVAKHQGLFAKIIIPWLLVAPLAASLTFQTPHALRSANMVVPLVAISAYGLTRILVFIWSRRIVARGGLLLFAIIIVSFHTTVYLHQYYVHLPHDYALDWQHGFKELVPFVKERQARYNKIVVTDRYDQPYILFLFYLTYPPAVYQPQAKLSPRDMFGFGTVTAFDKYQFHHITREEIESATNTLFILSKDEMIPGLPIMKTILFPNGEEAFAVVGI